LPQTTLLPRPATREVRMEMSGGLGVIVRQHGGSYQPGMFASLTI
jgi:hypothetical protein